MMSMVREKLLNIQIGLLLLLCCILPCSVAAEVDKAEVRRQIEFHRQWMKEHTPDPESLNDSALIIETVRAIRTICHEPQVGAMIRYAGKKYGLQELVEYAGMRDRQDIDRDDQKAIKCLELLTEEAYKRVGEVSYPRAYAFMILTMNASSYEQLKHFSRCFHDTAKALYEQDSSALNHELWMMAQMLSLNIYGHYWENPTLYRNYALLIKEIYSFYKRHKTHSWVQVYLLQAVENYFSSISLYENYYTYENLKLHKEGLIAIGDTITAHDLGLSNDSINAYSLSTRLTRQLLHPNHPDVHAMECTDKAFLWANREEALTRLHFIQAFQQVYYDKRNSALWAIKNTIRDCEIIHHTAVSDTTFHEEIADLEQYVSEDKESFFYAMISEISRLQYVNSPLLSEVADLLEGSLIAIAGDNKIKELSLSSYKVLLQRGGLPGHENDFYDIAQEFLDCCNEYPTWDAIGLGKFLVQNAIMFGDINTAILLQRRLTLLLREMVGEKDPIFVCEYLTYGMMARDNYEKAVPSLDGTQTTDSMFMDLMQCAPDADLESNIHLVAGSYYCLKGSHEKGRSLIHQALDFYRVQTMNAQPGETENSNILKATAYSQLLQSYLIEASNSNLHRDSILYSGHQLETLLKEVPYSSGATGSIYSSLVTYYFYLGNYQKAKDVLMACLSYYDNRGGLFFDTTYLQIIQALINVAANIDNNMDLCHELAERLQNDLHGFEGMASHENYIMLLRTLYDLVEAKNPYDLVLLNRYYLRLEQAITSYWETSHHNDDIWYNHGLYLATKLLNVASQNKQYRAMMESMGGDLDTFDKGWNTMRDNILNNFKPLLEEGYEKIKNNAFLIRLNPNAYYQTLMCLAYCAEYCQEDMDTAEQYYREFADNNPRDGLMFLGRFLLNHHRVSDAQPVIEKMDSLFHDPNSIEMLNPSVNLKGKTNILSVIYMAYYQAGRYEKALERAYEFQKYLSTFIQQNLDLMTQNEREGFLLGNSTGSAPLLMLLRHFPERLTGDAYNATLRDKGLLLRANDRIQRAILTSDNDTLIHAVDSLRMLQQQLANIQGSELQNQIRFAEQREHMERLERYIARKAAAFRKQEDEIPTWQQVRDKLKKGEAAVEYLITDSALMALVLTKDCNIPQHVPIMNFDEGQELMQKIAHTPPAQLADSLYASTGSARDSYLYDKLWKPLEAYFNGATKIYYSPTGILNSLAFAAFTLPDGSYLIDHYELHQLTSTARIAYRDKKQASKKKALAANVYGALYYNEEQRAYYEPRLTAMRQSFQSDTSTGAARATYLAQTDKRRGQAEDFPFLENSLFEADAITALLTGNGVWAQEHIGEEPTEQAFRKMDGNSPDILLISTHGFFYNDPRKAREVPYLQQRQNVLNAMTATGLILADGERAWQGERLDDDADNVLSAAEVAAMNLTNTRLAVLSACETGLGASNSEGVYGLQRGFKQAGVRSICASLWSVNDRSTSDFMQSFFRYWLADKKEGAMQRAMIRAMKEQRERTPSPYYWAPFVLYDADL